MAGASIALAVFCFFPRRGFVRRAAPAENQKEFFAATHPGVVEGASLALVCRKSDSAHLRRLADATLDAIGAGPSSGNGAISRFLSESGISDAPFRWAIFSMGPISLDGSGNLESMPEFSLAVSFPHDIDRIAAAYARTKRADSPLSLSPSSVSGVDAYRIRTGGTSDLFEEDELACACSLCGELLLVGSTEKALARQIELYRDGLGEDPYFGRVSESGDAIRLFVPDFGSIAASIAAAGQMDLSPLDDMIPDGARKFRDLREFDFIVASGKEDSLSLKLAFRAANENDAAEISVLIRAAILKCRAAFKKESVPDPLHDIAYNALTSARVTGKDEYIKISVPVDPEAIENLVSAIPGGLTKQTTKKEKQ